MSSVPRTKFIQSATMHQVVFFYMISVYRSVTVQKQVCLRQLVR